MKIQFKTFAKLLLFFMCADAILPVHASVQCLNYFFREPYMIELDRMGVKYTPETISGIRYATILPDTNTFLGQKALDLMQWPTPIAVRVVEKSSLAKESDTMRAFYVSQNRIYPLISPPSMHSEGVHFLAGLLKHPIELEIASHHELEHAFLEQQAFEGKVNPLVSFFINLKQNIITEAERSILYCEEIYTYSSQLFYIAQKLLQEENLKIWTMNDDVYKDNDYSSEFFRSIYSGVKYTKQSLTLLFKVKDSVQQLKYKVYQRNNILWVAIEIKEPLKSFWFFKRHMKHYFYMPLRTVAPEDSWAKIRSAISTELDFLESLMKEYLILYIYTYRMSQSLKEDPNFNLRQQVAFLKSLKLPDPYNALKRQPLSLQILKQRFEEFLKEEELETREDR